MSKLTIKMVEEARENIKDFIIETNLNYAQKLSKKLDSNIYLKLENFQNSGSFKMRGACNRILQLTDEEKKSGVIASSAGNHAQGVSFSATKLGIKSTIIMPTGAPLAKVNATVENGAEVILHGDVYDDAYTKALEIQKRDNSIFIHPFDDEYVIAGQATIALEMIEQLDDIDIVMVPIGGGGIISGIAYTLKQLKPSIKVIGVQTKNAPGMKTAIDSNENKKIDIEPSLADGIAVAKPGVLTYELVKEYVDEIVLVSEAEIAEAMLFLLEKCNIISEGAGSVTVAAMLNNRVDIKGKNIVGVISGGNVDVTLLEKIINRALFSTNRRMELKINLKDKPGELSKLIVLISKLGGNVFNIKQGTYRKSLPANQQAVTVVVDTRNLEHKEEILEQIKLNKFEIL